MDYLRTERFNCLPYAGGWKDQPHRFIERGIVYANVYNAMRAYHHALHNQDTFKNWYKANGETMKVVNRIKDLRNGINS